VQKPKTSAAIPEGGDPAAAGGDAFDLWLQRSLRRAYDAVVAEPIPQDILRLIEDDEAERDRIRRLRKAGRKAASSERA